MKPFLFMIFVVILTPIYFCIQLGKKIIRLFLEIMAPAAEGIFILQENMTEFWMKIFKIEEDKER